MSGLGSAVAWAAFGNRLKKAGKVSAKWLFGPGGVKIVAIIVIAVFLVFGYREGKKAWNAYNTTQVTEVVLKRENARLKEAQLLQADQYKTDLTQQKQVFDKVLRYQNAQIQTIAERVSRSQKLDRDFAQAKKDTQNVAPKDDGDAAPVLDNAIDFLSAYTEGGTDD